MHTHHEKSIRSSSPVNQANYSGHLGTVCRRGYSGRPTACKEGTGQEGVAGCTSEAQQRAAAEKRKETQRAQESKDSQRERQFAGGREYSEQNSGLRHWHVPGACRPARPQPPPSLFRNTLHPDLHTSTTPPRHPLHGPVTSPRLIAASARPP